jgi:hypothetical protein
MPVCCDACDLQALLSVAGSDRCNRVSAACRPGYQANIALFMAPVDYTLGDYLTWPQTDALANEQLAYIRVGACTHVWCLWFVQLRHSP